MKYNEKGEELPDSTKIEVPLHLKREPPMHELIKQFVRRELSAHAEAQGMETFEEANDFGDESDDELPMTPYEVQVLVDEDVVSHVEREALDKRRLKEENDRTVNRDRTKESDDVQQRRTGDDRQGVGNGGEKRRSVGGEGRSAGNGGGGVSEVSRRGDRAVAESGDGDG